MHADGRDFRITMSESSSQPLRFKGSTNYLYKPLELASPINVSLWDLKSLAFRRPLPVRRAQPIAWLGSDSHGLR